MISGSTSAIVASCLVAAIAAACADARVAAQCVVLGDSTTIALAAGETRAVAASASCIGVPAPRLVWSSSAPSVAAIDSTSGLVRAVAPGSATLHVGVAGVAGRALDVPVLVLLCNRILVARITPSALVLPVGGTGRLGFTSPDNCTGAVDSLATWRAIDTTIAVVDAQGTVRGVRVGQTTVRGTLVANTNVAASVPVTVTAPSGTLDPPVVAPSSLTLAPGATSRLTVHVPTLPNAPAGVDTTATFRSADPCVATVTSGGVVAAHAVGRTVITVAAGRDSTVRTTVGVTVALPAVLRLTFQSLTTGTPPSPVDPAAVRGTIAATVHVGAELVPTGGRLDLALGDRVGATAVIPQAGSLDPLAVTLSIATDGRDAAGARLFANGPTTLAATLVANPVPSTVAGCAAAAARSYVITQAVTVANP